MISFCTIGVGLCLMVAAAPRTESVASVSDAAAQQGEAQQEPPQESPPEPPPEAQPEPEPEPEPEPAENDGRAFYIPRNAKLQIAGNVGMLALGPGWSWWEHRLDLDLLVGWVPPLDGTESIFSSTLKFTVWPTSLNLGKQWRLRPISAGAFMNFTFGDHYFITQPSRYPNDYYRFSTAVRFGGFLGGSIGRAIPSRWLNHADLYWEVGFTDAELVIALKNSDSRPLLDVIHLAFGISVGF